MMITRTRSRLISGCGLLLLGSLLMLAEGCFSPASQPLFYQQTALPGKRIRTQILKQIADDLKAFPQSREAHLLSRFYTARDGRPAWIDSTGITRGAWQLIETLERADHEGLPPDRYEPRVLQQLLQPAENEDEPFLGWSPQRLVRADLALSRAFFRYAGDNLWGQERSWRSRGDWHRLRRKIDPTQLLTLALDLDAIPSALRELTPPQKGYQQLRKALQRYRKLASLGGWPQIADSKTLHLGEVDPRVTALTNRLLLAGDLSGNFSSKIFSSPLQQGLQRFQRRHGLTPDGALGPKTLLALNTPVEQRIDQILRNMERFRWETAALPQPSIQINLADYSLEASSSGEPTLKMQVVIGRQDRRTPLFTSKIGALVLAPYWYVPPSLLREALPRITADPGYLRRHHYEVLGADEQPIHVTRSFSRKWQQGEVTAALRQEPGPWNPMGDIKFLLPNPWSIYLHDTPQKELFGRTRRAFSAGCIRLSHPQALARWLLQREGHWDKPRIDTLLKTSRSHMVQLKKPVSLRIGYWTAWVDDKGQITFRDDIYGRDQSLAHELHQTPLHLADARL